MKVRELTEEMFQQWKADNKDYFQKHDPTSMNLINVMLGGFDTTEPSQADKEKREVSLWDFYKNDLATQGKLECDICGNKMEVYYKAFCFHCLPSKPTAGMDKRNNYLMAVKWLKNNEKKFNADWVWDYLYEKGILLGNDTWISLPDSNTSSEFYNLQIELFKKHFEIDGVLWYISW